MEHDVIILYLIAGVSFTFALFNCILFALKHGKTMKTDGTICRLPVLRADIPIRSISSKGLY